MDTPHLHPETTPVQPDVPLREEVVLDPLRIEELPRGGGHGQEDDPVAEQERLPGVVAGPVPVTVPRQREHRSRQDDPQGRRGDEVHLHPDDAEGPVGSDAVLPEPARGAGKPEWKASEVPPLRPGRAPDKEPVPDEVFVQGPRESPPPRPPNRVSPERREGERARAPHRTPPVPQDDRPGPVP